MLAQVEPPAVIATPVRTFTHPDTGGRITYLGTVHAALPDYFVQLGDLLADLDAQGAVIHYEQVHAPTEDELAAASEEIRQGADDLKARFERMDARLVSVGMSLQREALVMREAWQNHDVSRIAAAHFYGGQVLYQQRQTDKEQEFMISHLSPTVLRSLMLQSLAAASKVVTGEVDIESIFPGVERQVATWRETVALAAVDVRRALEPEAHIVLLWGAGHLPGFTRALTTRGFKEDGQRWINAIDPAALPPLD
jgi:hypothetical protein